MKLLYPIIGLMLCGSCLPSKHQIQQVLVGVSFPACVDGAPILTYIFSNPNPYPVTTHPAGLGFTDVTSITALEPPELTKLSDAPTTLPHTLVIPANGQVKIQAHVWFFSKFKFMRGEQYQVRQTVFSYDSRRIAPLLIQTPTITFRTCK